MFALLNNNFNIQAITNWVFSIYKILEVCLPRVIRILALYFSELSSCQILEIFLVLFIKKFFFIKNNNSDTEFYLLFVLVYTTTHEKLKVSQNCVKWVSPEWNSYQTVLRNISQLIFKNKGEVWFFLFFYCENTFSVTNTHFTPDKKSFKWVPHTALIWHQKTPLGETHFMLVHQYDRQTVGFLYSVYYFVHWVCLFILISLKRVGNRVLISCFFVFYVRKSLSKVQSRQMNRRKKVSPFFSDLSICFSWRETVSSF